jgi:hypothetical protein
MSRILLSGAFVLLAALAGAEEWEKDLGKPAPNFIAAGWAGTPVSLESIRGNTVVLAFWNADVAC